MQDQYISDRDGERINPATEELQREICDELSTSSEHATNDMKFQKVTVGAAGNEVIPVAHGCHSALLWTASTTVYIDDNNGNVEDQQCLIPQNVPIKIPCNNVGNLRFTGSAGTEVINIMSFN